MKDAERIAELEAFDKWFRGEQLIADHIDTTFISEAFLSYKAFKAGAAWLRTQVAGVTVVTPPQCTDKAQHVKYRNGWNSCLSAVARLNKGAAGHE